jgi:hypothetical protein
MQFQKDFCHCRGNAFVAIQECMGLGQMIGIRRGTGGEGCLVRSTPGFPQPSARLPVPRHRAHHAIPQILRWPAHG